jgi:hypothetical protein
MPIGEGTSGWSFYRGLQFELLVGGEWRVVLTRWEGEFGKFSNSIG